MLAQCNFPIAARWVAVPERNLKRVIGRLNASPSVELSDKDAAKLTGLTIERAGSLSASVFNREIERLVALQKSVEGTGVGSWTGIEQADLDELRAIMTGDRWRAYRPYLLRVLNHPGAVNVLNVDTCGANVRVFNVSDALLSTRPTHTAVVVFLHEPPKDILVSWGVNDRPK